MRGGTEYSIPTLPSRVGMRDVFYLDSLGRSVSPVLQDVKGGKPHLVHVFILSDFSPSVKPCILPVYPELY